MHRISTKEEYYATGRVAIDVDGVPVEYGDTGWRDVSEDTLIEGVGGKFLVRRIGSRVDISINNFFAPDGTAYAKFFFRVPVGFRKTELDQPMTLLVNGSAQGQPSQIFYTDNTRITWLRRFPDSPDWPTSEESQHGKLSFSTDDAWPSSLPGIPA